jgi:NADH:ubiquinone oxidoreductase subunit F (NADH-binding)
MTLPGLVVGRPAPTASRLRIDASRCGGKGTCVRLAPSLFALDRFGYAYVLPGAQRSLDADASLRILAREAVVKCPDGAIRLDRIVPVATAPAAAPTAARPSTGPRLLVDADESLADWLGIAPGPGVPAADLHVEVDRAGLAGQGGGRFPVAAKWRTLGRGPAVVVANAAEREPGTVKDDTLLRRRPFAVLDGIVRTAIAVGADRALIAIDADRTDLIEHTTRALTEAEAAGITDGLTISVVPVPARYVVGEETALLAALSGGDPLPHVRPPHPTERGLAGRPTLVHNIETLVDVALVGRYGAAWFRETGTQVEPGTGAFSVGTFEGPAVVHEAAFGTPLRDVLHAAGVVADDLAAVVVGGWSGGILRPDQLDVPLDHRSLAAVGASLGTKAICLVPSDGCPVAAVHRISTYFAGESAGQCPSCVQGLPYVADALRDLALGALDDGPLDELHDFLRSLPGRGACALPDGAVRMVRSLFTNFADLVDRHRCASCATCKEALG